MRTTRRVTLAALLPPLLAVTLLPGLSSTSTASASAPAAASTSVVAGSAPSSLRVGKATARKRHHRKHKRKRKHAQVRTGSKPQRFDRRTVQAVRGIDKITVKWPARLNATGYTVAWTPLKTSIPTSPAACTSPCQRRFTRGTSTELSSAALTTYGRRVSSASGNSVYLKVFAHNGTALTWTGLTYPYDAWISPARDTTVDWLPALSAQMPLPYAPAAGTDVAVTSFNLLSASSTGVPSWSIRAPRIVSQINGTGASIVATQENSNSNNGVGNSNSQYQDLANRLAPSGWSLADGRDWDAALGSSRSWSTQAVRTYYKSSVWSQVSNGALLTHTPLGSQTSGINVDRWVSWTKLRAQADSNTQVCVVNAHLLSNQGNYDWASADHRNREIAQILSELNDPVSNVRRVGTRLGQACAGTPIVFAGDLNSAQEHRYANQPQATMLGAGFVDTKNAGRRYNTRWSGPGSVGAWHETWGTQIDYLLTKGMGGAKTFKVNAITPSGAGSDHYPVTAVVSVPALN